jgi:hypothetical protein
MRPITTDALRESYSRALAHENSATDAISTGQFSSVYPHAESWALGPFRKDDTLTFRLAGQWPDPTGVGWTSDSIFNPSIIERDGSLYLFYRASPRKESTASRIGLAVRDPDGCWHDSPANPLVYPTTPAEVLGCEDPKVYAADGRYFLFYNGIWATEGTEEAIRFAPDGADPGPVGCDILLAVSDDLQTWSKVGIVVPHEISRLWAKGAVIPRDARGNAVRIGGEYLMFLSEGCGGRTYVGHSPDMREWEFREQPYLDLTELGGSLYEVACATVPDNADGTIGSELILDFFYADDRGEFAAAQARYLVSDPFTQTALQPGGSLAWGGLLGHESTWMFAQGWDAPPHQREIYFYRSLPTASEEPGVRTP